MGKTPSKPPAQSTAYLEFAMCFLQVLGLGSLAELPRRDTVRTYSRTSSPY